MQLTGSNCLGDNYLESNYPGLIIRAPIVRVAILLEAIFWRAIIQGEIILGVGWAIVRGAIVLEPLNQSQLLFIRNTILLLETMPTDVNKVLKIKC